MIGERWFDIGEREGTKKKGSGKGQTPLILEHGYYGPTAMSWMYMYAMHKHTSDGLPLY